MVGILSIIAQTLLLSVLMRTIGNKNTVLLGLGFQLLQLAWYGFGSEPWMMWAAGTVAAMSSITFPAVSALVSHSASPDQQGVAQGMITGIRGLCNGLGPALYGFIFYLFNVELSELPPAEGRPSTMEVQTHTDTHRHTHRLAQISTCCSGQVATSGGRWGNTEVHRHLLCTRSERHLPDHTHQ
uniref:Major facilitator superfamily (MFS) profile domain-containing protein n=1 Tax=Oryzias sinensis TaxID=183150 RepID=A0A8C7WTQ0_9TELE